MPDARPQRRSRAAPLIRGSAVLHLGAAGLALARPQLWPWALSLVVGDHLLLTGAGLWPRSRLLGSNWTRLPATAASAAIALTIDDGPEPGVTERVLEVLEAQRARATFFCIGERVARHAALARAITAGGHEIGNHSQRHLKRFALLGPRALTREIVRTQEAIGLATGEVPRFFRAPAGLRNLFLEPVLARAKLQLVSWTRRGFDTVTANAGAVLGRLTRDLAAGDILLLHDGHASRTANGAPVILEVLPLLLAQIAAAHLTPVTLHQASTPTTPLTPPATRTDAAAAAQVA